MAFAYPLTIATIAAEGTMDRSVFCICVGAIP